MPPAPFNLLKEEWIESHNEKGEPNFESWEALSAYMQVEDEIEYDYKVANMPPDPLVCILREDSYCEANGYESPFRTDRGVAMAILRSSNVHFKAA